MVALASAFPIGWLCKRTLVRLQMPQKQQQQAQHHLEASASDSLEASATAASAAGPSSPKESNWKEERQGGDRASCKASSSDQRDEAMLGIVMLSGPAVWRAPDLL